MDEASMAESESRCSSEPICNGCTGLSSGVPAYCEIIILRHGETAWNIDNKIQGQLDIDLNDVGRQQAAAVAARLSNELKISVVYSSDLKRAFDTAEIIAKRCGVEVIKDPCLRERHLGDLQGLLFGDMAKVNRQAYEAFTSHQTDKKIPVGGESFDDLYQRCTSSLQKIGQKHQGERVVVVTHGGVIKALCKRIPGSEQHKGRILNASINVFHLPERDPWTIEVYNDASHLKQTKLLKSGFGGGSDSG